MEFLIALLLPILLSAVGVFLVSSIFHMALPIHKGDTLGVPNEEAVGEAMRAGGIKPGEYMMPFCGEMKEMGTDEFKAKLDRGPVLFMTVMPNGPRSSALALAMAISAGKTTSNARSRSRRRMIATAPMTANTSTSPYCRSHSVVRYAWAWAA